MSSLAVMVCVGGYSDTSRVTPPVTVLGCECASSPWVFTPMIDSVVKLGN